MYRKKACCLLASGLLLFSNSILCRNQQNDIALPCKAVSPNPNLRDPEFNHQEGLVSWQKDPFLDENGYLIRHGYITIAPVDPLTGLFETDQAIKIKKSKPVSNKEIVQGPEWGNSQRGWEVFYTCYSTDLSRPSLCRITRSQTGHWEVATLANSDGHSVRKPSQNVNDPIPKITFEHFEGILPKIKTTYFGFREDTFVPLDIAFKPGGTWGKWSPDASRFFHIIHISLDSGRYLRTVGIYNVLDGKDTPMFKDNLERFNPFPWQAPELGGETVVLVHTVKNPKLINTEVYREDSSGNWFLWTTIDAIDPKYPMQQTAEPFIFRNRSYISVVGWRPNQKKGKGHYDISRGSVVGIASIDPLLPLDQVVRRIVSTEPDIKREGAERLQSGYKKISIKRDAEPFITPDGARAWIYYKEKYIINNRLINGPLVVCDSQL